MVPAMTVVVDEPRDLVLKVGRLKAAVQQKAVLQCLVAAFDLTLGLWRVRRTANVSHAVGDKPVGQVTRDVAGTIVGK